METVRRENRLLSRSVVIGGLQCLLTWWRLGLFSRALVLILHFQPPQGSDRDNTTKNEISRLRGGKKSCVGRSAVSCTSSDLLPLRAVVHMTDVYVLQFAAGLALCSPSSVKRSLTDAYYHLPAHSVSLKSCFSPSSQILHVGQLLSAVLMHSALGDARQMCTVEGGIRFL